jgi:hypothetical protein
MLLLLTAGTGSIRHLLVAGPAYTLDGWQHGREDERRDETTKPSSSS